MFYITNPTYIKIWKVERKERYTDIYFSTSEKAEKNGETVYINSNWNGRCVGKAHNQAEKFEKGTSAKALKFKLTAEQYKDKEGNTKTAPTRTIIFEFESSEGTSSSKTTKSKKTENAQIGDLNDFEEILSDGDVPF